MDTSKSETEAEEVSSQVASVLDPYVGQKCTEKTFVNICSRVRRTLLEIGLVDEHTVLVQRLWDTMNYRERVLWWLHCRLFKRWGLRKLEKIRNRQIAGADVDIPDYLMPDPKNRLVCKVDVSFLPQTIDIDMRI